MKQPLSPKYHKVTKKIELGLQESNKAKILQGINDANLALSKDISPSDRLTLLYFLSNVHDSLYYRNERTKGIEAIPLSKNLQEEKRLLTWAIEECKNPALKKQLLVNLANALDLLGRGVEAISVYDQALKIDKNFSMAKGNKAIALKQFADIAGKYRVPLYILAYGLLKSSIDKEDVLEIGAAGANESFKQQLQDIERKVADKSLLIKDLKHKPYSKKGFSKFEKFYIDFCVDNNLFLNFHIHENASTPALYDPIFIEMITPIDDNETFYKLSRYINQIKEDYAVARLQLVQSQYKTKELSKISQFTSYAYALDYSNFNIYYGLLKSSFGKAFNILDKIAEFLKEKIGKEKANQWRDTHITGDYRTFLDKLYFVTDFELDRRNKFYAKISSLVMENGFRVNAPAMDLLKSPQALQTFLGKAENNPDTRLEIAIKAIKDNPSLLDLEIVEIAKELNIPYLPASKSDIASFMTYLYSKTKHPVEYKEEFVEDVPEGSKTLNEGFDTMIVANLNFDFSESSEILFDYNDFIFMADKMEVIFVNKLQENTTDMQFLRENSKSAPEIAIVGFVPEGEKYITFLSEADATRIINNDLKDITLAIKFGDFDLKKGSLYWAEGLRPPELVIYNYPTQMKAIVDKLLEKKPDVEFTHLHSAFMEESPLQMLYFTIDGTIPIHALNHFGNRGISPIVTALKPKSKVMEKDFILSNKKALNNYLAFWCGQRWEPDWVEGFFDKTHLYFRDGRKISVSTLL